MSNRRIFQTCSSALGIGQIALTGIEGSKKEVRPAQVAAVGSPAGRWEIRTVANVDGHLHRGDGRRPRTS